MSFGADAVQLAPNPSVFSGATNYPSVDLSGYSAGIICINCSVAGTTFLPAFSWSDDGTNYDLIPQIMLALLGTTTTGPVAAITGTGRSYYQFLPANLALPRHIRLSVGSVTGSFTIACNAYMRRG
jgi:hypothetical protein